MKKLTIIVGVSMFAMSCNDSHKPESASVPDKVMNQEENKIVLAEGMLISEKDTICGMKVGTTPADTVTVNGQLYGFCNPGCKEEFLSMQTK